MLFESPISISVNNGNCVPALENWPTTCGKTNDNRPNITTIEKPINING